MTLQQLINEIVKIMRENHRNEYFESFLYGIKDMPAWKFDLYTKQAVINAFKNLNESYEALFKVCERESTMSLKME